MKKVLILLTAVCLTFAGCVKENEYNKKLEPVLPGLNIYNATLNQQTFSAIPADMGVRLAMLLAEAKLQEKDFTELVTEKVALFGTGADIVKQGTVYLITYVDNVQAPNGAYIKGKLSIAVGNDEQLVDTFESGSAWEITIGPEFKVTVFGGSGSSSVYYTGGRTLLFSQGDGTFCFEPNNIRLNVDEVKRYSDWSGSFTFTPADPSLAYSLCKGKDTKLVGAASGPSFYTFSSIPISSGTELSYKIEKGVYNGYSFKINAVETCALSGSYDYDSSVYPAREVLSSIVVVNNTREQTITYNGVTVTL